MTVFSQTADVASKSFDDAMVVYTEALPVAARQTVEAIKERVRSGKEKLYIGSVDGKVALMALLYPLESSQFVLLDYIAVKPEYQKRGIGSEFLKNIYRLPGLKNRLILMEVDDPKSGPDQETKQRRVYFYRKNGAKILKQVHYVLPPLQGDAPTDMVLLVMAQNRPVWLSGQVIRGAIRQIYSELYLRDESDPLLESFVDKVPDRIELG